jgi:hypothetical protein
MMMIMIKDTTTRYKVTRSLLLDCIGNVLFYISARVLTMVGIEYQARGPTFSETAPLHTQFAAPLRFLLECIDDLAIVPFGFTFQEHD